ncbi:hypothetical protein NP233_g1511 [Leucocoprinus birnbaumii]|uniref:Uncharacterized protein n=1 Tax=Leucocoprinus birnbaumii TaxID=56174 RepID=A0AAD5W307_9AGAR|nr:hypothetical protein NP233_g1511 [Leucocoprinus birnbaumii]
MRFLYLIPLAKDLIDASLLVSRGAMFGIVPHLRNVDLPGNIVDNTVALIIGNHEQYPPSLVFHPTSPLERSLDESLRYGNSHRAVIVPIATPRADARHIGWGLSTPLSADISPFGLAFLVPEIPATCPPVSMMFVITPPGLRDITILPKPDFDFITCGDVQKEVVRWMQEITVSSELGNGLTAVSTRTEKFYLPDGREVDIELWQWKGLKKHGPESDVWELYL